MRDLNTYNLHLNLTNQIKRAAFPILAAAWLILNLREAVVSISERFTNVKQINEVTHSDEYQTGALLFKKT